MSEPTVQIPARIAVHAAKIFHSMSVIAEDPRASKRLESLAGEFIAAVDGQCAIHEIEAALSVVEIEERNWTDLAQRTH